MAQENGYCYTFENGPNFLSNLPPNLENLRGSTEPITVRLYIHILRTSNGLGGRTPTEVDEALNILENDFALHNIFFRVACTEYIDNDVWYLNSASVCYLSCTCLYTVNQHTDGIDIYIKDDVPVIGPVPPLDYTFNGGLSGGIPSAEFPDDPNFITGFMIGGMVNGYDVTLSSVISHEMGHVLGLYHTYYGTCPTGPIIVGADCPLPTYGTPCLENTSNCADCGDFICDTPTDPFNVVNLTPTTCEGISNCGLTGYYPDIENIMSSSQPNCLYHFTADQGSRMRDFLTIHPALIPCVITNPDVGGTLPLGLTYWTGQINVTEDIIVATGSELYIDDALVYFADINTGIVIKPGAILRINNSTLQGNKCTPTPWQGILIEGNTNKAHPTDYYTNGSPHHGVAIVENSTVRDAITALHAYDLVDVVGSTMGGGIVYAKNSQFINNRVSIQLDRFRGEPGGPKYYQKSIIEDNVFYNDNASWFHIAQDPFSHIALNTAGPGLTIRQNTLTAQSTLPLEYRGTGIRTVNTHLNVLNNQFNNILHGIDAYSLPSLSRSLTIKGNTFFTTHRCLSLSGGVLATIAENNFFDIQAGTAALNGYGIFADGVWGYDISANTFTCTFGNNTNNANLGIIARNGTNQASVISDNYFGGSFGIANYFEGQNSRLTVDCNIYDNNVNTDWVINGFLNDQGECYPSDPIKARRNVFHTPIAGVNGYNIDATNYANPADPTSPFRYVGQPGFNPASVIGNISVNNVCFIDPVPFENSQCSLDPDACGACDPDCWRILLDQTTEETKIAYLQTRLLRAQLCSGREEDAKSDLRTRNTTESAKLLAATYYTEYKADSTWLYLNQIPDDNAENTAFKELYTELLNGIAPAAGSGKTMGIQEAYLRQTALQEQEAYAPIAQAINAGYYGEVYYKNVKPSVAKQPANSFLEQTLLTVYPNPAMSHVQFLMPTDGKRYRVIVTNMYGKQIAVHLLENDKFVWNTDHLSSGLYFCALVKQNGEVVETHKLVIAR